MSKVSEATIRARAAHHAALAELTDKDGLSVWRKLRRVEQEISRYSECYCNGGMSLEAFDVRCENAKHKAARIMGKLPNGFFVNRDPRGYALKIESEQLPQGMWKDWGGYGILAPVIDNP